MVLLSFQTLNNNECNSRGLLKRIIFLLKHYPFCAALHTIFSALHTNNSANLTSKQKNRLPNKNPPSRISFLQQLKGPLPNYRKIKILHRMQY